MMQEKEVMQLLEETEAVLHGHFLLTSGLHSPMYVEKFNVLQHPKYTEMLCQELAERYAADNVELVVGPMTGGILLAHEVGKALGTRAIFTERENGKTGGSVKEVLEVVKAHGGVPVGIGLLVDRSGGKVDFGMRTEALLHLDVPTYDPNDCPLCKEGKPFTKLLHLPVFLFYNNDAAAFNAQQYFCVW